MRRLSLDRWHQASLRRTLLLVLFPGLLALVGAELWLTWRTAEAAANAAYDRSLLGAIKAMDANISTASGGLSVELPYVMLEFFELTASGRVYYRVATEDGLVEIGNADLPEAPRALITGAPQFSDAVYYGDPIRIGSYARVLDRPLAGQANAGRVVIQVAETIESRTDFTRSLVLQTVARDLLLIVAAAGLLALAVGWALRPLARLRSEVQSRPATDLTPISTRGIPADVQPLVEAINHHVERNRRSAEARRRFIDDASHQLRTPLATMATQVGYALRADPQQQRDALLAIRSQLDETVRQTNQMLALARSDSIDIAPEAVDAGRLIDEVTRQWWSEAREQGVDLGLESDEAGPVRILAQPGLVKEAFGNLLHNAIRYTPRGGHVTARLSVRDGFAMLAVLDDGPGIPPDEIDRAGERFFRASNVGKSGSGLGLAIVRSVAERLGGQLQLANRAEGGLLAEMRLPLAGHSASEG
ncbi:sensor histidine kinase [Piscinibacter sakaiensis]|uniref:sensor histidine kinase n=1 Tax=Piscinibacter sakaiensis TaxID=1547922 RepID=UPI003AAFF4DF